MSRLRVWFMNNHNNNNNSLLLVVLTDLLCSVTAGSRKVARLSMMC